MYWPYGVVLNVLGVQAGVKVYNRLKGSKVTVEEQQQQFELSIGGTVRQTLLKDTQTLPHHVFIPFNMDKRQTLDTESAEKDLKQETETLTGLLPQVDVDMSCHQTVHIRELQLRLKSRFTC